MRRYEESSEAEYERAIKLGEENARYVTEMRRWCKHVRIEQQSGGLYAQMSGLPIGGHNIECPYAEGGYSANVRWICTDFLVENCNGCPHHEVNGDAAWGRQIIAEHEEHIRARDAELARRNAEITRLRSELRAQSQLIGKQIDAESQQIVVFLENLFSEDDATSRQAARHLIQSARVGADLFPDAAIALLLSLILDEQFAEPALAVCAELANQRPDLAPRLESGALAVVREGRLPHKAAAVIARLGDRARYPLAAACIERLLLSQRHEIPIGGWPTGEPDYADTTTLLARSCDANAESVLGPVRRHLQDERDAVRVAIGGALNLLQGQRPDIFAILLPDLLASLALGENERMGSHTPSGMIIRLLRAGFSHAPSATDTALREAMQHARPAVREDLVDVYGRQFLGSERDAGDASDPATMPQRIAIQTLLTWMQDEEFEPEIRHRAVEALKRAADYFPELLLPDLNALLGYYALLSDREEPPPARRRIVLPGEAEDLDLKRLGDMNRRQHWGLFKHALESCLEKLCKQCPLVVFPAVYGCLHQPTSPLSNAFRGTLVTLLGRLGADFSLQQRALPVIMRELMNYGSAWVRAKAIDAVDDMFSTSTPPPANVVDTILVHLRDTLVVVHQAAVRAVYKNPSWFTEDQALMALNCLAVHVVVYGNDPSQLERICDATLGLARRHPRLKRVALAIVERSFPTGEQHSDEDIAVAMVRLVDPNDSLAPHVAVNVAAFLASQPRDRLNHSNYSDRERLFRWLHALPVAAVANVSQDLLNHAKSLASTDYWESWHFASLFSQHAYFAYEREVLEVARDSLPPEPRFDDARADLECVIAVAVANEALCRGDGPAAEAQFEIAFRGEP